MCNYRNVESRAEQGSWKRSDTPWNKLRSIIFFTIVNMGLSLGCITPIPKKQKNCLNACRHGFRCLNQFQKSRDSECSPKHKQLDFSHSCRTIDPWYDKYSMPHSLYRKRCHIKNLVYFPQNVNRWDHLHCRVWSSFPTAAGNPFAPKHLFHLLQDCISHEVPTKSMKVSLSIICHNQDLNNVGNE
jgi:hypothetical protein